MIDTAPTRATKQRSRPRALAALAMVACLAVGTSACQAFTQPSPPDASPSGEVPAVESGASTGDGGIGEADGDLPSGVTAFDGQYPGIANLRPELLDALRQATTDAADDGVDIQVTSGWRSAGFQNHLLKQAIEEYGSEEEAARWVATSETSSHVSGEAVDIAPYDAIDWLARHGAAYGLCQIYGNEPWHYELRPDATQSGCPTMYPDPTHDPRMR